jgi:hypothetical protein
VVGGLSVIAAIVVPRDLVLTPAIGSAGRHVELSANRFGLDRDPDGAARVAGRRGLSGECAFETCGMPVLQSSRHRPPHPHRVGPEGDASGSHWIGREMIARDPSPIKL